MKGTFGRLSRTFLSYGVRILSLLLAVSIISFVLVSASPIDPVQQYILGLGTAVSPEQRAEIEEYWGVNEPPVERYFTWLGELLKGIRPLSQTGGGHYRRTLCKLSGADVLRMAACRCDRLCPWLHNGNLPEQMAG